jgi:type IV pilus assembly protein PilC
VASFTYKARDAKGQLQTGTIEALTQEEAVEILQKSSLIIVSISKTSAAEEKKEKPQQKEQIFRRGRIADEDLILFCRQLATMLQSGVTLLKTLDVLSRQVESKRLNAVIGALKKDIESGATFKDAMDKHPDVFSKFWVNLVETGEASGHLPETLDRLATYLEARAELKKKIVSALIYPALLSVVGTLALAIFIIKVVPIFAGIFDNFEMTLPPLTQAVIGFSDFIRRSVLPGIILLAISIYLFRRIASTKWGRRKIDRLIFKIPVVGSLIHLSTLERFASGMSILLESGVPILYALEIMGRTSGNVVVQETLEDVKVNVRGGKSIAYMLRKNEVFPAMMVQMVEVGEEIGELSKMLERVASFYERMISTIVGRLTTLFEPIALVFMGIFVFIIVLAMFLPIFNIATLGMSR